MEDESPRLKLPLLVSAQAAKEQTHNEALFLLDVLLHPVVEDIMVDPAGISAPNDGQCWLVGANPLGLWQGHADEIACWNGSEWRFVAPVEGMKLRNLASTSDVIYGGGNWIVAPNIAAPAGGSVIDVESRTAINAILVRMTELGLLQTSN